VITPVFALLGTMVVSNRMAFFTDVLGHSALAGIAIGVVCGNPESGGTDDHDGGHSGGFL